LRRVDGVQEKPDLTLEGQKNAPPRATINLSGYLYKGRQVETHYREAMALVRELMPLCRRIFGLDHDLTISFRENYADLLFIPEDASRDDQREAVAVLADATKARRRIFGANHPYTVHAIRKKEGAQMRLEDVDAPLS
jgi:hypothetical protein